MTLTDAQEEYLGAIVIISAGWGIFITILVRQLSLEKMQDLFCNPFWILAALGTLSGLFITAMLLKHAREILRIAQQLEREGVTASGMIVDKWLQESGAGTRCHLVFCFSYMNNIWIGEQLAISAPYQQLQVGDCVTTRFLHHNPRISRITQALNRSTTAIHPTVENILKHH